MSRAYIVAFKPASLDQLKRLDRPDIERILEKLLWLARNSETLQHEAMTGQWGSFYRYRVGHYRVVYQLERDEHLIVVEKIGHRRDVYDE
jgi:mRNA interferase RelE/StbE